jgi:hypothetical protein
MQFQLDLLKRILNDEFDDYTITFKNQRCKLPTAYIYPARNEIVIVGNKPSLIRYALADLIYHEIAESEFYDEQPDFKGDSHNHPDFMSKEFELKGKIIAVIEEEHD